jgi:hypothetical protein
MFVLYSFIGSLPEYIIYNVYQTRLFFDGDIYLIIDDINSPYLEKLKQFNVKIVNYDDVIDENFCNLMKEKIKFFYYVSGLTGRELLFSRSNERFFLAANLMKKFNLEDCIFLELDVLIYKEPENLYLNFKNSNKDFAIIYDSLNAKSMGSGICFIKNKNSIDNLLNYMLYFINNINELGFYGEMVIFYKYYYEYNLEDKTNIYILPSFPNFNNENIIKECYENYINDYGLFDSAQYGIYILGEDPFHNNGLLVKNKTSDRYPINCSHYKFKWELDEKNRNVPYINVDNKWILLNNLHCHAKNLEEGISQPLL